MELATLYTDFHKTLLTYIRSKTDSKEDAEDILHNVFVKIAGHEDILAQKENLKNWVFIITRNAVYDYYRSKGIGQHEKLGEVSTNNLATTDTTAPAQGLEACLLRFIDQLPDTDKYLLIASELKGEKQNELAQQYHMPYSTLKSRVQRGRNKLKQMLTDCCQIEINKRGEILEVLPKNNCAENSCNSCEG
jgi:RNA polymerase sigma-70 factor (ECF subfamily)